MKNKRNEQKHVIIRLELPYDCSLNLPSSFFSTFSDYIKDVKMKYDSSASFKVEIIGGNELVMQDFKSRIATVVATGNEETIPNEFFKLSYSWAPDKEDANFIVTLDDIIVHDSYKLVVARDFVNHVRAAQCFPKNVIKIEPASTAIDFISEVNCCMKRYRHTDFIIVSDVVITGIVPTSLYLALKADLEERSGQS